MLRSRSDRRTTAGDMRGPKALRSTLVTGSNSKVDFADLDAAELLGQGAYGMVHRMTERLTGQSRVMKTVVRPDGWDDERLKMEAELLQNLDHPHILRIFSWYEENDSVNIVMEHCEGGELQKVVQEGRRRGDVLPEVWLATAVRQCFEALVYIHAKGVVHKDLKGQNLLLLHSTENEAGYVFSETPHVIVCDLGIAEVCCRGIFGMRGKKVAGTPATMAPEVWKGSCGPKSDVWSMGCVMFELFTNKLPFEVQGNIRAAASNQATWLAMHRKGPNWDIMRCSADAKTLNQQCLTFKESLRPTAADCLKHAWFSIAVSGEDISSEEADRLVQAVLLWKDRNPTQRAFCLKMASGCTCISKFARLFSKFDTDNSGVLDRSEVVAAMQSIGIDRSQAKKVAHALDVNNDNSCEYLEFAAACLSSLEKQFDELLRQEFRALDVTCRGELMESEFGPFIEELAQLARARGLQIQDIDENGDGAISFEEFCAYFGRPGVEYRDEMTKTNSQRRKSSPGVLPMKQHIRLVNNVGGTIERSMEQIRQSMENKTGLGKKNREPEQPPGRAAKGGEAAAGSSRSASGSRTNAVQLPIARQRTAMPPSIVEESPRIAELTPVNRRAGSKDASRAGSKDSRARAGSNDSRAASAASKDAENAVEAHRKPTKHHTSPIKPTKDAETPRKKDAKGRRFSGPERPTPGMDGGDEKPVNRANVMAKDNYDSINGTPNTLSPTTPVSARDTRMMEGREEILLLDGEWDTSHKHSAIVKDGICSFSGGPSFPIKKRSDCIKMNGWRLVDQSQDTLKWEKAGVTLEWYRTQKGRRRDEEKPEGAEKREGEAKPQAGVAGEDTASALAASPLPSGRLVTPPDAALLPPPGHASPEPQANAGEGEVLKEDVQKKVGIYDQPSTGTSHGGEPEAESEPAINQTDVELREADTENVVMWSTGHTVASFDSGCAPVGCLGKTSVACMAAPAQPKAPRPLNARSAPCAQEASAEPARVGPEIRHEQSAGSGRSARSGRSERQPSKETARCIIAL